MHWLLPALALPVAATAPSIAFKTNDPRLAPASAEYRQLWCSEGLRVIAAMTRVTGHAYPGGRVEAFVGNVTPMTAFGGTAMSLKASYPVYYKLATLVHELGHRLAFTMPRAADLDEHRLLYLFLYDVWDDLYGRDFADRMVSIERQISGRYDYAAAWDWALGMTRTERQARLAKLRGASAASGTVTEETPGAGPPGCDAIRP